MNVMRAAGVPVDGPHGRLFWLKWDLGHGSCQKGTLGAKIVHGV